jgi:uncharacterized protein (TIGR03437 family)
MDASGFGQGAILNQDGSINSSVNPAAPSSVVSIYATGAGQSKPTPKDGSIAGAKPLPEPVAHVSVEIGGLPAEVLYAGAAPGLVSGALQVNARVPAGVTPGPLVPVVLKIGDAGSQTGVTLAVQ